MAILTLQNAILQSKATLKLKVDGKLSCTASVKEDGAFYNLSTNHANLCFSLANLNPGANLNASGTLSITPYTNRSNYPAASKTVYLDTITVDGEMFSKATAESNIFKYKLLKYIINHHAILATDERAGKGLASFDMCKATLKKLHEEMVPDVPFENVKFNLKRGPLSLEQRNEDKRRKYTADVVNHLVETDSISDVMNKQQFIDIEAAAFESECWHDVEITTLKPTEQQGMDIIEDSNNSIASIRKGTERMNLHNK